MTKMVLALVIVVFVGFVAAIQEAYESGFSSGYCEGMKNCEELHRKEKENGQEDKSKSV